jgi:23S rRNA pseudouridine1911/1915/1917 synthase
MARTDRSAEPPFRVYHLTDLPPGQTLAAAIRAVAGQGSWGDARKLIATRRVQVNGNLCLDPARRVTARDVLKIWQEPLPKPIRGEDLRLVYVDRHLVVVEKPPGITSVRHFEERQLSQRRRQLQPTLEELLPHALARSDARTAEGRTPPRRVDPPGRNTRRDQPRGRKSSLHQQAPLPPVFAVHRLDRDTSGLMLFARTRSVAELLGAMFRKHSIEREYLAVVLGTIGPQTIRSHLIRDRGDGHRGSVRGDSIPDDAQLAVTHVEPVESLGEYTIIRCRLETGRTHQIRIHLAEAGHMLCGEPIYRQTLDSQRQRDLSSAPRQALHSASLRLTHPVSGQALSFRSPWPPDLARWLDRLRASRSGPAGSPD